MVDDIPFIGFLGQTLIAFLAGILGGIVSFRYQKRYERKTAEKDARREFTARLLGRLEEIVNFWDTENSGPGPMIKSIQNQFGISATQIRKDISNPPNPLRPEIKAEFQDLIVALNRIYKYPPVGSTSYPVFIAECNAIIEKVEHIKTLDAEWFEIK
jgi:hypothetical protein